MTLIVNAIYSNGVLRPIQAIDLPEGAQVSLVIETRDITQTEQHSTQILSTIAAMPLETTDNLFSNREHDQVIYTIRGES